MTPEELAYLALTPETRARRLALRERKMAEANARFMASVADGTWEAACRAAAPAAIQEALYPAGVDEPAARTVARRKHEGMA